jgi:hypothetical protein
LERDVLRHRLRVGGSVLIPLDADEVLTAARRNKHADSPEFRAIRESIAVARVADVPRFPAEMPWFLSVVSTTKAAIMRSWNEEAETPRARDLSSALLDLHPRAEQWIEQWHGQVPPDWVEAVNRVLIASLAVPVEIADRRKLSAYQAWIDERILAPLRRSAPERYDSLVEDIRQFVIGAYNNDESLEEMARLLKSRSKTKSPGTKAARAQPKKHA